MWNSRNWTGTLTRRALIGRFLALLGAVGLGANCGLPGDRPTGGGMMGGGTSGGGMMGSATSAEMSSYMDLFNRHTQITRRVDEIPGGVRTTTESEAPELVAQLQTHVTSMYGHLNQGAEVTCMSNSLPTLFRNASRYHRQLTLTAKGVLVTEASTDPAITRAIREHAQEVSGFVREGMPAMMHGMMGG